MYQTLTHKTWVPVVVGCTRFDAVIASRAPVQIDYHRLAAIIQSVLDDELKQRGIAHNAQDLDSLASSTVVADLLVLCRALTSDADRLSWLALLRAPWCGLSLADLLLVAQWGDRGPDCSVPNTTINNQYQYDEKTDDNRTDGRTDDSRMGGQG